MYVYVRAVFVSRFVRLVCVCVCVWCNTHTPPLMTNFRFTEEVAAAPSTGKPMLTASKRVRDCEQRVCASGVRRVCVECVCHVVNVVVWGDACGIGVGK